MDRVLIVGTGLIGTSIGLALRRAGYSGEIVGLDRSHDEAEIACGLGAIDRVATVEDDEVQRANVIVLCLPVIAILGWMERLSPRLRPGQLVTDVGSTKRSIRETAAVLFADDTGGAAFLPGHPMAGKEHGGAALADGALFDKAMWLFTPLDKEPATMEAEWRGWVEKFGARTMDMDAARHDQVCAWVSHLPQMVSTAMSAMFADEFAEVPELAAEAAAIGGRAFREMTRLGASPYSMWRDVAMTNTQPLAATLFALEQRLAHVRNNLKTPELRDEFAKANAFRAPFNKL